jgi:2-iminobutanoate/2-iminopropanoate deaminase
MPPRMALLNLVRHRKNQRLVESTITRCSTEEHMPIERRNYSHLAPPVGPYVHAVKSAGLLFLSGITAYGTSAQGQSLARQTKEVFEQIKSIAQAEGSSLAAVVKVTIFITSFSEVAQLREVLFQEYGENLPASSLVQVASLFSPEVGIEVEAVLAAPDA